MGNEIPPLSPPILVRYLGTETCPKCGMGNVTRRYIEPSTDYPAGLLRLECGCGYGKEGEWKVLTLDGS